MLAPRILSILKESNGSPLSGAEIAGSLNVTRSTVWKQIRSLRNYGYRIESLPSQGYKLLEIPDGLIPFEIQDGLTTAYMARNILYREACESTNDIAHHQARRGAQEGTAVVAEVQRSGRGRLGRSWESPPDANLYTSIILRPPFLPAQAPQLTLMAAVAVAETIEKITSLSPRIKWPNDVYINQKKISGILTELECEMDRVHWVVLGIGVNINMKQNQFSAATASNATSLLEETGTKISRPVFARQLFTELENWYEMLKNQGIAPVIDAWEKRSLLQGRRILVRSPQSETIGKMAGLDESGYLLIQRDDGATERIIAGDITLCEAG